MAVEPEYINGNVERLMKDAVLDSNQPLEHHFDMAGHRARLRHSTAAEALLQFGTTEDIEAAAKAVARIAAKAMRRRG